MKLVRIYSFGKVFNYTVYEELQVLDKTNPNFKGCGNEFLHNREWWVILDSHKNIIAYCGCLFSEGICIFVRAWVDRKHRGKGLQKRLIDVRIRAAKRHYCHTVITYTTLDNYPSANNLIRRGFKLYNPEYQYGGSNMLYFAKEVDFQ
jgi:GNAT superfamily N-acetyltransferase